MADAVERLGGVCTWRELRSAVPWRSIGDAVTSGEVVRHRRGLYGLPVSEPAQAAADRLCGVVSHRSAALHWGWKVKATPRRPDITIARHRRLPSGAKDAATIHWRNLGAAHVVEGVTTRARTVVDCCLDLPLDEALSVFDSALRDGLSLMAVVDAAKGIGPRQRRRLVRVARLADRRAANPFESVLRAIAVGVSGLSVVAQHSIRYDGFFARVDLADPDLQIVLEADSFEFHAERRAFDRDCRRYDELTARGWLVLRFSWEQVMFEPAWVASMISLAVDQRQAQGRRAVAA